MSLVPRSRCQLILGTLLFHLWSLGGQKGFSCGYSRDLSFQPIPSYSHQICVGPINFGTMEFHLWPTCRDVSCTLSTPEFSTDLFQNHTIHSSNTKARCQVISSALQFQVHFSCMCPTTLSFQPIFSKIAPKIQNSLDHASHPSTFWSSFSYIWGHQGAKCIFSGMCPTTHSFQPIFYKFTPIINWTMLQTSVCFCHHLVTFVATRELNAFFLVCALQVLVFNWSFPNSHQVFVGPCFTLQYIFVTIF